MTLEEMREVFGIKIYLEYEVFKLSMLQKGVSELYQEAYKIDTYINLYELLLEISQRLDVSEIKSILLCPNLLAFLYDLWLKYEDSHVSDLEEFLRIEILKLEKQHELEVAA